MSGVIAYDAPNGRIVLGCRVFRAGSNINIDNIENSEDSDISSSR